MSLHEVAGQGNRLATLRTLRDSLAADLDGCESLRDKAALSQRLMDVLGQIDVIEKAEPEAKGSPLDELAKRRSGRPAPRRSKGNAV